MDQTQGAGQNQYDYANCDPLNQVDLNGEAAVPILIRLLPFILKVASKSVRIAYGSLTRAQKIACLNAMREVWDGYPDWMPSKMKVPLATPGMVVECVRAIRRMR